MSLLPTCRSCGAPILWASWMTSGKSVPLDAVPRPDGNIALVNGRVHTYSLEDERLHRDRYVSHFVSCPDADTWRGAAR